MYPTLPQYASICSICSICRYPTPIAYSGCTSIGMYLGSIFKARVRSQNPPFRPFQLSGTYLGSAKCRYLFRPGKQLGGGWNGNLEPLHPLTNRRYLINDDPLSAMHRCAHCLITCYHPLPVARCPDTTTPAAQEVLGTCSSTPRFCRNLISCIHPMKMTTQVVRLPNQDDRYW